MRRRRADRRPRIRDVRFNSETVTRLITCIMQSGKKSVAERIVYGAFDRIAEKAKDKNPLDVLQTALENVKPRREVKSRRGGGAKHQGPGEVRTDRQEARAR